MKIAYTSLICFLLASASVLAQPASLPIGSLAELKSWALKQIQAGSTFMHTPSLVDSESPTGIFLTRNSEESIGVFQRRLLDQKFKFRMLDRRDPITVYATIYGATPDGEMLTPLFSGEESTEIQDLPNGKFGFNIPEFKVRLMDRILLPIGNATFAEIIYRDEAGQYLWPVNLPVRNGGVEFLTKYAGKEGQLIAWYLNSNNQYDQVAYNLGGNGERVEPFAVTGAFSGAIENYFEVQVPTTTSKTGTSTYINAVLDDRSTSPVVNIKVTKGKGETSKLTVYAAIMKDGQMFDIPTTATIRSVLADGSVPPTQLEIQQNGGINIVLPQGEYHLMLESPHFDAVQPTPDYDTDVVPGNG